VALSDSDIQMYVRYYLARARAGTLRGKVKQAWVEVNAERLLGCGGGGHLVFVEHYLYLRYVVGSIVGRPALPFLYLSIPAYDGYKAIAQRFDLPFWQEGKCPASTPSARVRRWAWTGAVTGASDFEGTTTLDKLPESVPSRPLPW
jgi:hypothetical protein